MSLNIPAWVLLSISTACAVFVWAIERWRGDNEYDD